MSLTLLLLQLTVILTVARACGLVLRAFGQPMVIGEMAAGILLGPVVFGALCPQWHAQLFPAASLASLSSLAMVGVVLFMFIVGAELRAPSGMGAQLKSAGWVGVSSMVLPRVLGLAIAPVLHPSLAPEGVAFWPFALFLGVGGRVGAITSAHLRAHGASRPRALPTALPRQPSLRDDEAAWLDAVVSAARGVR